MELEDLVDLAHVERHIRESNEIESIYRDPTQAEIDEHIRFMNLEEITVEDLQRFVYVYAGAGHRLRNLITDHHQIGSRYLNGGPEVIEQLQELLDDINRGNINPWRAHVEYEVLHPFTDGNGRSGRVIWHWMMKKKYGLQYGSRTHIGFLHRFYYQSMQWYQP